eukprot:CAMPEP_0177636998 /NCGR_PEP_ID=MMETSP0447-20121125/4741_1 /TAXON_ID=0 /ORGANISM="Stygamoeba regulata, Strain BSH-02190019" /LENGTH=109 /DNA_ID=CAMNT_0019138905 /DNA_START=284 /DNA_END=613 /DNA_ORIENTATION=-
MPCVGVCFPVNAALAEYFGRHEPRCAEHGQRLIFLSVFRGVKVTNDAHLHFTRALKHKHVVWFQIPMDDLILVQERQALGDIAHHFPDRLVAKVRYRGLALVDHLVQRG